MTNIFQTIVFATRSNDGVVQEHPSLNDALESFISQDGYRLDFLFPDGRILYIHRGEYGEDVDSPFNDHPVFNGYNIANAKVLMFDPQTIPQPSTTNVVPLFRN
jgi:hypothetical protein